MASSPKKILPPWTRLLTLALPVVRSEVRRCTETYLLTWTPRKVLSGKSTLTAHPA